MSDTRRPRAPIIALAPNDWQSPWRNRQQLLSRLADRGWPVVYSHGLLDSWNVAREARLGTPLRGRFRDTLNGVRAFEHGLTPFRFARFPAIDKRAIRQHASRLLELSGQRRADLLLLFHPMFLPYAEHLNPRRLVYYMYDSLTAEVAASSTLAADWRSLVAAADLVIATSEQLAASLPGDGPRTARVLHNGADAGLIESLAAQPCPEQIAAIPHPRIGYSGVVNAKLNYTLVHELATRQPQWHWVFIGPEADFAGQGEASWALQAGMREKCRTLPNVHFVGELKHPDYLTALHHMDVTVLCNRTDEGWWRMAYPLKFHEYLASGRPVVSAHIASLSPFTDVAAFADSPEEWLDALTNAVNNGGIGTPNKRRALAATNDWNQRTDQFERWLNDLLVSQAAHEAQG